MAAVICETDAVVVERTVFSGCSEADQACAKLFWQSLTLQPPIESRLVSGDVRQRLKVAPPGKQSVHRAYEKIQTSQKLSDFLERAHAEVVYAQSMKLTKQATERRQTLHIFQKRKRERKAKEAISHRPQVPSLSDEEDDFEETTALEASEAMADLDNFELHINTERKT